MNKRLTFQSGSSHKEYNVYVKPEDGGFVVDFAYGRVGSTLKSGRKTTEPVPEDKAIKIATSLLNAKIKKGYVPDSADSESMEFLAPTNEVILLPQLANPVNIDQATKLGDWYGQIKKDGERRILSYRNGKVIGLNRRGIEIAVKTGIKKAFASLCDGMCYESLTVDSEDMGSHLYIFDVLEWNGNDQKSSPFVLRQDLLSSLESDFANALDEESSSYFEFAQSVKLDASSIADYVEAARKAGEEGVILRSPSGTYEAGRPNSGGNVVKIKFTNDASVIVEGVTAGKRSVKIAILENGALRNIGNVTIPANAEIPVPNSVIDVAYLWVLGKGGSLIQPVYKRDRTGEILPDACCESQLVYRNESVMQKAS